MISAPENPAGFVACIEAQKAALDNGYRLDAWHRTRLAVLCLDNRSRLGLDRGRFVPRAVAALDRAFQHHCRDRRFPASPIAGPGTRDVHGSLGLEPATFFLDFGIETLLQHTCFAVSPNHVRVSGP